MSSSSDATTIALADLPGMVGKHLGHGDWETIDQEKINRFADATGDHQWIHIDAERAKAGPFGTTIGHGYLTLALVPIFVFQLLKVDGAKLVVNYGINKARFPAPVPPAPGCGWVARSPPSKRSRAGSRSRSAAPSRSRASRSPPV